MHTPLLDFLSRIFKLKNRDANDNHNFKTRPGFFVKMWRRDDSAEHSRRFQFGRLITNIITVQQNSRAFDWQIRLDHWFVLLYSLIAINDSNNIQTENHRLYHKF